MELQVSNGESKQLLIIESKLVARQFVAKIRSVKPKPKRRTFGHGRLRVKREANGANNPSFDTVSLEENEPVEVDYQSADADNKGLTTFS